MIKELKCLERIDQKNYLTEREHREFLKIVQDGLWRLAKYEEILKDRSTKKIENPQYMNDYEQLCAHSYHIINKLGKLEDIYDEGHKGVK